MTMFDINYQKRKNKELFKEFEEHEILSMSDIQNYTPIYKHFFSLNETNYNNINLNHSLYVSNVKESNDDKNCFKCLLKNINEEKNDTTKNVFFKMAPLLDPYKYMIGKYNINDPNLLNLPSFSTTNVHPKLMDPNNSSYVDGFFSFLSSKLLANNFVHGVNYYGSFLGIKNDFVFNVMDDIEYLVKSDFFNKHKNTLFEIQDYSHLDLEDDDSVEQKLKPIVINEDIELTGADELLMCDSLEDICEPRSTENKEPHTISLAELTEMTVDEITNTFSNDHTTSIKSSSTCSSRTSHTSKSSENEEDNSDEDNCEDDNDNENEEDENKTNNSDVSDGSEKTESVSNSDSSSEEEEETLYANIPKFPIQLIAMEQCENTFDDLILNSELDNSEWMSAFMQIIMILLTYQKAYSFTHNDLHTNNIMYNLTDKKYLNYCYKKKYYRVPTHGKIFKIIDFGRSIYKFNNVLFCSDSFQTGGDAATQYNTEPYMIENKPRLDPNYSFDLCRLACSIFDYLIDDMDELKELCDSKPFVKLVVDWCLDDNGVNVLYKNNGGERYPDFKLYKMIARHVHNHTPAAQLERKDFSSYEISKSKLKDGDKVMNIDEICNYTF
jgi:hypothetical protein